MNEADTFKLLAGFGGPGVVAYILWLLTKRYMDAHAASVVQTHAEMGKRIDALEVATKECEADRRKLNERMVEILTSGQKPQHQANVT